MPDVLQDPSLAALRVAADAELHDNILPFWKERAFTGDWIVGVVTDDLDVVDDVPRHSVLVSRILWTFSSAAQAEGDRNLRERWLAVAEKAFRLIVDRYWDRQRGGVYWSLNPDGSPFEDRKQVYAQGFALYGLVEWARTTGDPAVLDLAWQMFGAIETHAREPVHGGYLEALTRDWSPLKSMALSERDLNVPKSMNTNLHVLEAYTNLTALTGDDRVRAALRDLLRVFLDRIVVDTPWTHCQLFSTLDWRQRTSNISFGHDIEASWLLWETALAVGDEGLISRTRKVALSLADAVLDHGVDPDGSILYEAIPTRIVEPEKHWWPQAEGVIGWLNAYRLTGDVRYRDAALATWDFIEDRVVDRVNGEWFSVLSRKGEPLPRHPGSMKIGPWKGPYHNSRVCLEIMRRIPG